MVGLLLWSFLGLANGGAIVAALGAVVGYLLPDVMLARQIRQRGKAITNGLPDVLDLMIVCIEAGSSLDQSIVKASDELELAHPALADELRVITTEIRAGKPRIEAFQNFAKRTKVDDVRSLVAMLTQTDRFGTSVAMALRTHADTSRTKRRQRAEEQAAKVGVKLDVPARALRVSGGVHGVHRPGGHRDLPDVLRSRDATQGGVMDLTVVLVGVLVVLVVLYMLKRRSRVGSED